MHCFIFSHTGRACLHLGTNSLWPRQKESYQYKQFLRHQPHTLPHAFAQPTALLVPRERQHRKQPFVLNAVCTHYEEYLTKLSKSSYVVARLILTRHQRCPKLLHARDFLSLLLLLALSFAATLWLIICCLIIRAVRHLPLSTSSAVSSSCESSESDA